MTVLSKAAAAKRRLIYLKAVSRIPRLPKPKRRRLAIITGELEVGGVGRVLLNIIHKLPRDRYEIVVFTTDPRENAWAPEFRKYVDRIVDIPLVIGRGLPLPYVNQYLAAYLNRNTFDILFITNSLSGYEILPDIQNKGASQRAAVYDLMHTHGRPTDDDAFLKLSMPYDSYITERIVISQYLKQYFCEKYPVEESRVRVIYNGIDNSSLNTSISAQQGRKFLGVSSSELVLTYLGRLQEDKSPDRLVELGGILKNELKTRKAFIAIVGEGSLKESLIQRAEELGISGKQVRFYPFTTIPLDVCAASYSTIITSDLEGIPMSALESMQAGTPVIAPAVGGLPEIVADRQEGFIAPFDSHQESARLESLASSVRAALALSPTEYRHMRERAHNKVLGTFTSMGSEYLKLFDSTPHENLRS